MEAALEAMATVAATKRACANQEPYGAGWSPRGQPARSGRARQIQPWKASRSGVDG